MRDMDEVHKGLQAEGRTSQERLEASLATINDLIRQRENLADTRMSEKSAIMKEKDRQAEERLKLMSELMQLRNFDANNRMVELMTTMQDLTLIVRAIVVVQTAATQRHPSPIPVPQNLASMPSTSAAPPSVQTTYRKVAQPNRGQAKPPKPRFTKGSQQR